MLGILGFQSRWHRSSGDRLIRKLAPLIQSLTRTAEQWAVVGTLRRVPLATPRMTLTCQTRSCRQRRYWLSRTWVLLLVEDPWGEVQATSRCSQMTNSEQSAIRNGRAVITNETYVALKQLNRRQSRQGVRNTIDRGR